VTVTNAGAVSAAALIIYKINYKTNKLNGIV